jgi:Rnl2 family RNA ligase
MRFHLYQSIPADTTASYVLSKKDETRILRQAEWIGLEKAHGANVSVYHRPGTGETRFAKRTAFLKEEDHFYDWKNIRDELSERAAAAATHILSADEVNSDAYIVIHGELCGKFYPPASEAATWTGAQGAGRVDSTGECVVPQEDRAVNEGIYYCDKLALVVFDMAIVRGVRDEDVHFLDYDAVMEACTHAHLPYLKPLVRGTKAQVEAYPYKKFDSKLGESVFGMPALPSGTNVAEGIVIKPVKTFMVRDARGQLVRCLVKLKNPDWSDNGGDYVEPKQTTASLLQSLAGPNRVLSLLSKHGDRVTEDTLEELVRLMVDDVLQDVYTSHANAIGKSTDWERDVATLTATCRAALSRTINRKQ